MKMIAGNGMLKADGKDVCRVEYKISIKDTAVPKSAGGMIWGSAPDLMSAFTATAVTLVRDDGGFEMKLAITSLSGDGQAQVAVSGSPGPY